MPEDILLDRTDGIATVTFNRPDQRNAIDYHGWLELRRIAIDLDRDDSVRVVVFTGAGDRAFSAGADIKDFESYRDNSEKAQVYGRGVRRRDGRYRGRLQAHRLPHQGLLRGRRL